MRSLSPSFADHHIIAGAGLGRFWQALGRHALIIEWNQPPASCNGPVGIIHQNPQTMKHNHNHDNAPAPGPQLVPVRFEFAHPTATTVCIAGTFNNWEPKTKIMNSSGGGNWWKETNLAPGTYEYCLVVDGQWTPDPLIVETVPNPFGGRNSVLTVFSSKVESHLAKAEHSPLKNANKPRRQ